jgi:hypothetical protein
MDVLLPLLKMTKEWADHLTPAARSGVENGMHDRVRPRRVCPRVAPPGEQNSSIT